MAPCQNHRVANVLRSYLEAVTFSCSSRHLACFLFQHAPFALAARRGLAFFAVSIRLVPIVGAATRTLFRQTECADIFARHPSVAATQASEHVHFAPLDHNFQLTRTAQQVARPVLRVPCAAPKRATTLASVVSSEGVHRARLLQDFALLAGRRCLDVHQNSSQAMAPFYQQVGSLRPKNAQRRDSEFLKGAASGFFDRLGLGLCLVSAWSLLLATRFGSFCSRVCS